MKAWRFFRPARTFSTEGMRIYAIGDVHGCFDALVNLFALIEQDNAMRTPVETHIIMLGDYIDRGPDSARVCDLLYSMREYAHFHCLRGNHEQTLLDAAAGNVTALDRWMKYGGGEALKSWGVSDDLIVHAQISERDGQALVMAIAESIPQHILEWMSALPVSRSIGDYMFVHAGVRPKVALDAQSDEDMIWIRDPFLRSNAYHGKKIVHGHSVVDEPQLLPNRIGIDTGAYRTGVLTSVGIEDGEQWIVQSA